MLLAELDAFTKHLSVASVGHGPNEILLLVVSVPHLSARADCRWQGVVDDDVAGDMEIGDAAVAVYVCYLAPCGGSIGCHDVGFDRLPLGLWQICNLLVNITQAIVHI